MTYSTPAPSTLKCCHTPALTQPQPSHIQRFVLGFLPAPGHQLHLQLCWDAPSITSSSSPRSHSHHGTHPPRVWRSAEAPPGWDSIEEGEAVGGAGPAQHLSMPQVKPAPFTTAAFHSCTALDHPPKPTKQSSPVLFALSRCWGTNQHHLQKLLSSPRCSRVTRCLKLISRFLPAAQALSGSFSSQHRSCTGTQPTPHLFLVAIYHQKTGAPGC